MSPKIMSSRPPPTPDKRCEQKLGDHSCVTMNSHSCCNRDGSINNSTFSALSPGTTCSNNSSVGSDLQIKKMRHFAETK
jgi:hypothetical protein